MSTMQVRARTFDVMAVNLADIMALPDAEAAPALNDRMGALDLVHKIHERTYAETGIIAREFERRKLYEHLIDPDTDRPFPNFTSWASCSNFLACRRIIFESKRDMDLLNDIPSDKLLDVPKSNIKVLTQLSTHVRNDQSVLDSAKNLPQNKFLAKLEKDNPDQHIETRRPFRFMPGRSDAKVMEQWIAYAMEHDIAGSATEAVVRACEYAMHDALLDEELASMPVVEEVEA
jgi:hypothetical protein